MIREYRLNLSICGALLSLWSVAPVAVAQHSDANHDHHLAPAPSADTPQQQQRLRWELEQLTLAVQRYRDFKVAKAEGWKRFGGDAPLMGEHWYREGAREPLAGEPLNLSEPTTLQYAVVGSERQLVGVSYNIRIAPGDALPEGFSGTTDHWHIHDVVKILSAATEERPFLGWLAKSWLDSNYRAKGDNRSLMAMLHAWVVIPNPDGIFAMHNRVIPYVRVGLPVTHAEGGDEAAANGINLAADAGCADALDGTLWIAQTSRAQRKALFRACGTLAARMKQAISNESDPTLINAAGSAVWHEFEQALRSELSGKQLTRIDSMTEH